MTDLDALRRLAIIGAALAVILGVVGVVVALAAFDGDRDAFAFRPETILGRGPDTALLWRWAMLSDMFYSYLLLVPLALRSQTAGSPLRRLIAHREHMPSYLTRHARLVTEGRTSGPSMPRS
jgi:hypothetical protein